MREREKMRREGGGEGEREEREGKVDERKNVVLKKTQHWESGYIL